MLLTEFTTLLKNLWEKLMNNIKKYIKNIWTIMPMHTKKEKFYLNELKKHLNEYVDDHPQCSYDDIVQQFGDPKDIVVDYIQNSNENELIKRMKLKSIIQRFLIFFSVICTILAIWIGILWYDYIQDQKNSIIYEIETTITEHKKNGKTMKKLILPTITIIYNICDSYFIN